MSSETGIGVSVVMLVFERNHFLDRAIRSVLTQDYQDWELIVVDDGGKPETQLIITANADPRIRYFRRDQPGSVANAYNFAIQRARGRYIAILDDDDYWLAADKLSRQVTFLNGHPEYVGCGGGMVVVDEASRELMCYFKPERHEHIQKRALLANPMAHSTTVFRRCIAGEVQRYDESLPEFQDWDLWLNLAGRGKLYNFPELFTGYTLWRGNSSLRRQRRNARSALRIVWRHRQCYGWFPLAIVLAILQYLYAHLPAFIRNRSYSALSRLKKIAFAERRQVLPTR